MPVFIGVEVNILFGLMAAIWPEVTFRPPVNGRQPGSVPWGVLLEPSPSLFCSKKKQQSHYQLPWNHRSSIRTWTWNTHHIERSWLRPFDVIIWWIHSCRLATGKKNRITKWLKGSFARITCSVTFIIQTWISIAKLHSIETTTPKITYCTCLCHFWTRTGNSTKLELRPKWGRPIQLPLRLQLWNGIKNKNRTFNLC